MQFPTGGNRRANSYQEWNANGQVEFVADAYKIGASKHVIAKMVGNVGLDFAVGLIPVVGDLADFAFKSNTKNLRLLKDERQRLADAKLADMKTVS